MHTVGYTYDDYWRLKKITHNGFDYEFTYDKWGNVTSTSAGGHTLSTNTYAVLNGNLTKTTYGNGGYIEYTYDNYDRITAKKGRKSIRRWDSLHGLCSRLSGLCCYRSVPPELCR